MRRTKINFFIFFIIISGVVYSQPLDSLINYALAVSPKLKMLQSKYSAAESRININSNLPDPMLTLGLMNLPTNSFSFTQEPMTGKVAGLSQAIPFPGKLVSTAEVAEKDVEIIKQEIIDAENEIIKDVSQNYYELIFTRKANAVAKESKKLLKDIAEVVRAAYAVARASQQNLLKAELEITNINDQIEDLKNQENSAAANLNAILLRPQTVPIKTGELPSFEYFEYTQQQLDSLAEQYRPFLKGIEVAKQKAELQEQLAKFDYYPNFNFSLQYSQRDRIASTSTPLADFFSFMVGINIPINYGGKVDSKVEEAQAMQTMYDEQYQASLQMLSGNFGTAIAKLNSLKERIKLIEEALLPQAQHTYTSTLSSYQVAEVDFINVIDAQNALFKIETNLYRHKTDYLKQIEELKFLTGKKLK